MACVAEKRNSYKVLLGKPAVQRPLSRPKLRSEDNIKKGSSRKSMWAWNGLICCRQGQVAASCKRGDESLVCLKCAEFLD